MTLGARLLVAAVPLGLGLASLTPIGQTAERWGLDRFQHGHRPHADVVIVAIDSASIDEVGRWPWSRRILADLLGRIDAAGSVSLGVDLVLATPESPEADQVLADRLATLKTPTVLASEAIFVRGRDEPRSILEPLAAFQGGSVVTGHVTVPTDLDGLARQVPERLVDEAGTPAFSQVLASRLHADLADDVQLVQFAGPAGTVPTYPASAVLAGEVGPAELGGRVVLVGTTASSLHDTVLVPLDPPVMAGVEWQATVVGNLLLGRTVHEVPSWVTAVLSGLLIASFLGLARAARPRAVSGSLIGVVVAVPLASRLLWEQGIGLPYLGTLVVAGSLFVGHGLARWSIAEGEKRRLRTTITPYFSPAVLQAILADPRAVHWGGERRDVTVLFSDIRNFTTISESIPPERLTRLLHEYFTAMDEAISETDGVLSEFVGDGIVAFWGAPVAQPDHADRAVRTALMMLERLGPLRARWQAEGAPDLQIGAGINSGPAIVGNTGSARRFDYAAIGDTTNVTSRIEGLNKEFGTSIIVSAATKRRLTIPVLTRHLGRVPLKGKVKPVSVYAVEPTQAAHVKRGR